MHEDSYEGTLLRYLGTVGFLFYISRSRLRSRPRYRSCCCVLLLLCILVSLCILKANSIHNSTSTSLRGTQHVQQTTRTYIQTTHTYTQSPPPTINQNVSWPHAPARDIRPPAAYKRQRTKTADSSSPSTTSPRLQHLPRCRKTCTAGTTTTGSTCLLQFNHPSTRSHSTRRRAGGGSSSSATSTWPLHSGNGTLR